MPDRSSILLTRHPSRGLNLRSASMGQQSTAVLCCNPLSGTVRHSLISTFQQMPEHQSLGTVPLVTANRLTRAVSLTSVPGPALPGPRCNDSNTAAPGCHTGLKCSSNALFGARCTVLVVKPNSQQGKRTGGKQNLRLHRSQMKTEQWLHVSVFVG